MQTSTRGLCLFLPSNRQTPAPVAPIHQRGETATVSAPDAHPTAFGDVAPAPPVEVLASAAGFVRLPRAVLRAPGLSDRAKLLYALLLDYARQDGCCWPGLARLRADLGGGHNQLARAVRELEAAGLVARRRRGFGRTTVYSFLPLPSESPAGRADAAGQPAVASSSTAPSAPTRAACAPRTEAPERPGAAAQSAPVRGAQDLEPGDQDAEDQHRLSAADTPHLGSRRQRDSVVARLIAEGVTPGVARQLVARCAPEVLERQLACHRHRVATGGLARNPAGALVRAIREDWAPPAAWSSAQQRAAAQARQAEEDARRREAEADRIREWELKSPDERIAGRLQFWVLGQRAKRREPTAAEIAARRAELLAELVTPRSAPPASPGAIR